MIKLFESINTSVFDVFFIKTIICAHLPQNVTILFIYYILQEGSGFLLGQLAHKYALIFTINISNVVHFDHISY